MTRGTPRDRSAGVDLSGLLRGLPSPPDPALHPYLDAAARCFARYGITRTSINDVAGEAGVSRSTVYRVAGTVENIAELLFLRELHRFLCIVPQYIGNQPGPESVIDLVAGFVATIRSNPVVDKLLADEPQLISARLLKEIPGVLHREIDMMAPVLGGLINLGYIADRDPRALAEWIARVAFTLIITPPDSDLRDFLALILRPLLTPDGT